jgi:hypothetical protein
MAIVPQISTVRGNTEVQPFFQPADLKSAVEGAQPLTHVTLHPGDYLSPTVDVPADVYVTALPGADIASVSFTGATGNVTDLSVIGGINPDRVNTLTAADSTLTLTGSTGNVSVRVADLGIEESNIAEDAITPPKLSTPSDPLEGQVLVFSSGSLAWETSTDLDLGVQTEDPITGDASAAGPIELQFASTDTVSLSVNQAGELEADIVSGSVGTNELENLSVTAEKLSPGAGSAGQYLSYDNGLSWDTLTAEDVGSGTFGAVGGYAFSRALSFIDNGTSRGEVDATAGGIEIRRGGTRVLIDIFGNVVITADENVSIQPSSGGFVLFGGTDFATSNLAIQPDDGAVLFRTGAVDRVRNNQGSTYSSLPQGWGALFSFGNVGQDQDLNFFEFDRNQDNTFG